MSLSIRRPFLALIAGGLLLSIPQLLPAGSTGNPGTTGAGLYMPQGNTAGTANGDFVSDTGGMGGANTFYRYFIEVPPGLTRLQVEIFDADVGLGGGTEDTAGRDRTRDADFESIATYSLLDPASAARTTSFTTGTAAAPVGSDNAWLSFFDSTGDDYRDNFGAAAYNNNDGTLNWATSWDETNDGADNAGNGDIRITGGELRLGDDGSTGVNAASIEREANLSTFTGATLSFNVRTQAVEVNDHYRLEVSSNGGGSWSTVANYVGTIAATPVSYNISSSIASNTRIRFIHVTGYGNNDFLFVDNLRIQETQIDPGHWELRVDMAAGDDINAIGIRAHDGNSGSGGTELNVYFDSFTQFGINPPVTGTSTRAYDVFPYVTAGCTVYENDFDYDRNRGNTGSMSFFRRTGALVDSLVFTDLSTDDIWVRNGLTGFTTDQTSVDYGIWSADVSISSYTVGGTPNGNYTTFYMSSSLAADPAVDDPDDNPEPGSFRTYLPTDAGAAPVKPYLEQLLTVDSGPNPPQVGQRTDVTVTVRLVNPTSRDITFPGANVVTAHVPAIAGVSYDDASQVSQGSIVTEPAPGLTGDITWNPGTVAAGATALMSYEVRVTPAIAGQRLPVTGTPASNGTRATYVDETGNTTQARATYTFGPICELALTQGLLTHAVVSSFRTFADERGGVRVEWTTASETGTAGFRLLRWNAAARKYLPVHEELLPGLLHEAQGGTYRFLDEGAAPGQPQAYLLEEVEANGRRRAYGPYTGLPSWERQEGPEARTAYEREAHPTLRKAVAPTFKSLNGFAKAGDGVHLSIRETGLYYVTREQVATWLGLTVDKAEKAIVKGDLSLARAGQTAAWWPDLVDKKTANGLFFYGEAKPTLYSLDTVYRLVEGSGAGMQAGTVAPAPAAAGGSFPASKPFEQDLFPATAISPDPESDYWFWDFVISGDPGLGKRTYTFDAPALAPGDGTMTVSLQGATDNATPGEHRAAVSVNGTLLGEAQWQGITPIVETFTVPDGVLLETGNQIEILGTVGGGAPFSFYFVDGFEAGYPHGFAAEGDALAFTSGGNAQVTVSGFADPAIRLLDVTNPLRPIWLTGAAVDADSGAWRASFVPSASARYFAAGQSALKAPVAARPWSDESLRATSNRADVLIVAPAGMEGEAERLADLRRSQGLQTVVASLDEVADLFGNGTATPQALRSFLIYAKTRWSVKPRYVVLAGEGTLDYRNLQGFGDSVMPPLLVLAEGGLFPSDNRLADVNGDGRADMAIGRIPVLTAAELGSYVDKILAYESAGSPAWAANALMLADNVDGGASFSQQSDDIAAQLPSGFAIDRIYLDTEPLAQARARLFQGIDTGASLIDFVGHGGLDRLSAGGLLTSADVPGLTNGERLPVLTAMTCTVNRFAVPGVPSLGELLVKSPDGGAAAVWGPSGLSSHGEARHLAEIFYRRASDPAGGRLGDWVLQSMKDFAALGGDEGMLDIYNLLGDPTLVVRRGPAPAPAGGSSGE
ncbi:MAG TPA: C25 family cysteine peptidase [Thermoanaerobaculia bacterium]|nr:C25 family cysteine peptidase [Thermoanaerobaculia bacterium]